MMISRLIDQIAIPTTTWQHPVYQILKTTIWLITYNKTMDNALPGWTQWQAHIEGHCAPREETSPPHIQQASTLEALDTTVDTLTPEMDSDLLNPPSKDRPVSERRHWRKTRREISMMDKSGKLTIQRHRRKNERRRFYPFCALVARPVGDRELREQPTAQKAMKDEWNRLRAKNVWDEHEAFECEDVRRHRMLTARRWGGGPMKAGTHRPRQRT